MKNLKREATLTALRQRQLVRDVPSEQQPVIELLDERIAMLRRVLDVGVEVKADDILEQLASIGGVKDEVEGLRQAIRSLRFPDIPDVVEIAGVDGLRKALDKHSAYVAALKDYAVPDVKVLVDVTDNQRIEEVTSRLDSLIGAAEAIVARTGQNPTDFVPYRRVRKVGNRLLFDDAPSGGFGGGSNGVISQISTGVAAASSTIYDGQTAVTPKFTVIEANNAGLAVIVPAVATKAIRVLSYVLVADGAVVVNWQSDVYKISGNLSLVANTGVSSGYAPVGHFQTLVGEPLSIQLTTSVLVGGHCTYVEVDG
jgi:hypothetical protein